MSAILVGMAKAIDIRYDAEEAEKAARAASLRAQGLTFRQIAAQEGCTPYTARERVRRAVEAVPVEAVGTLREIQIDSLLLQKRRVLRALLIDHPKVDHGKLIMDPTHHPEPGETHRPLIDWDVTLRASAELRKIEDSISRLTGTRAPVVHEVHEYTEDALDAEIRRLSEVIRDRTDRIAAGPTPIVVDATSYPTPAGEITAGTLTEVEATTE